MISYGHRPWVELTVDLAFSKNTLEIFDMTHIQVYLFARYSVSHRAFHQLFVSFSIHVSASIILST